MSAILFNLIKSIGVGLILGYIACYVFKKGLKIFIIMLIMGLIAIYIAGIEDSIAKIWNVIEGFIIFSIKNTIQTLYTKVDSIGGRIPFILGIISGGVWCLLFSK